MTRALLTAVHSLAVTDVQQHIENKHTYIFA